MMCCDNCGESDKTEVDEVLCAPCKKLTLQYNNAIAKEWYNQANMVRGMLEERRVI